MVSLIPMYMLPPVDLPPHVDQDIKHQKHIKWGVYSLGRIANLRGPILGEIPEIP